MSESIALGKSGIPATIATHGQSASKTAIPADNAAAQRYSPELAEWEPAFCHTSKTNPNEFKIVESLPDGRKVEIATIRISPDLSPENAKRIATLMSFAPTLWRELQRAAPIVEDGGIEAIEQVGDISHALWAAADRNPFISRQRNEPEEAIMRRASAMALRT